MDITEFILIELVDVPFITLKLSSVSFICLYPLLVLQRIIN